MATEQELIRMIFKKLQEFLRNQQEMMEMQNRQFQLMKEVLVRMHEEESAGFLEVEDGEELIKEGNTDLQDMEMITDEDTELIKEEQICECLPPILNLCKVPRPVFVDPQSEMSEQFFCAGFVSLDFYVKDPEKFWNCLHNKEEQRRIILDDICLPDRVWRYPVIEICSKFSVKVVWFNAHEVYAAMPHWWLFGWLPDIPPEPPPL